MAGKAPSAFGASAGAPEPESSSADNSNASTQNYGVVLDPFLGEESSARLPLGYEGSSQLSADINSMTFWPTATGISLYLDTNTVPWAQETQRSVPPLTLDSTQSFLTEPFDNGLGVSTSSSEYLDADTWRQHHSPLAIGTGSSIASLGQVSKTAMPGAVVALPVGIPKMSLLSASTGHMHFPEPAQPCELTWETICQTVSASITNVMHGVVPLDTGKIAGLSLLANVNDEPITENLAWTLGEKAMARMITILCKREPLTTSEIQGFAKLSGQDEDEVQACAAILLQGHRAPSASHTVLRQAVGGLRRKRARELPPNEVEQRSVSKKQHRGDEESLSRSDSSLALAVVPVSLTSAAASVLAQNTTLCSRTCTHQQKIEHKSRPRDSSRPYPCLFLCGKAFPDWESFQKHHQASTPQHGWLCNVPAEVEDGGGNTICALCKEMNPNASHLADVHPNKTLCSEKPIKALKYRKDGVRIFTRKDKFHEHFRNIHKGVPAGQTPHSCQFEVHGNFYPRCGLCGEKFSAFEDKLRHVVKGHFDLGQTMKSWQEPWKEPTEDDNGQDNNDDDDDGNNGDDLFDHDESDRDGSHREAGQEKPRDNNGPAPFSESSKDLDGNPSSRTMLLGAYYDLDSVLKLLRATLVQRAVRPLGSFDPAGVDRQASFLLMRRGAVGESSNNNLNWIRDEILFTVHKWPNIESHALLGYGSTSVVDKVRLSPGGSFYALKQHKLDLRELSKVQKELEVSSMVQHRHLSRVEGIAVQGRICSLLISPVAATNLAAVLQSNDRTATTDLWYNLGCIARALQTLHSSPRETRAAVFHFDLKPANILILMEAGDNLKPPSSSWVITDFGASSRASGSRLTTWTPRYAPPEAQLQGPVSRLYDLWSLGCIFLECVLWLSFGKSGLGKVININHGQINKDFRFSDHAPKFHGWLESHATLYEDAKKAAPGLRAAHLRMIRRMLSIDPPSRPCIDEIVEAFEPNRCCANTPRSGVTTAISAPESRIRKLDYAALGPKQIRLVSISRDSADRISCSLHIFSLEDAPPYEALSYMWGDAPENNVIFVDGIAVTVRANLYAALSMISKSYVRLLWIDMLCINRDDIAERSHQVALMSRIYAGASRVVAWLGEASVKTKSAIKSFQRAPDSFVGVSTNKIELQLALTEIFEMNYWKRMWIMQDVLAQNLNFIYGDSTLDTSDLIMLTYQSDLDITNNRFAAIEVLRLHHHRGSGTQSSLLDLLLSFRDRQCADQRDKVYALLDIANDNLGLVPDYSLSVQEVYLRTTKRLLSIGSLDVLKACSATGPYSKLLPTWVSDWSARSSSISPFYEWNLVTEEEPGTASCSFLDQDVLGIEGNIFDTIDFVVRLDARSRSQTTCREVSVFERLYEQKLFDLITWLESSLTSSPFGLLCRSPSQSLTRVHSNRLLTAIRGWEGGEQIERLTKVVGQNTALILTKRGFLGLGPKHSVRGDSIVKFAGARALFVLRPTKRGIYQLVGECFLHGIVDEIRKIGPVDLVTLYIE